MGYVDIVFDHLPGPYGSHFIEVEDETGASIKLGSWLERPDGLVALRFWRLREVSDTTLFAVDSEMAEARAKGYTARHDDVHGSGHLVTEVINRLQHPGEFPSDDAVKHEIVVAIGLLFNAIGVLERVTE